jgi:hypothetical protein
MTTCENSRSRPVGEEYRLNGQSLVKKWRVSHSKKFAKNQELVVLLLKCKPTPIPAKLAVACTQSKIYDKGSRNEMRDDMHIPGGLLFMWGVVPSFLISCFGSCFTKKTNFSTLKTEKALSVGQNGNRPSWSSSPSQGPRACPIWPRSGKLFHDQGRT